MGMPLNWEYHEDDEVLGLRRIFRYNSQTDTVTVETQPLNLQFLLDHNQMAQEITENQKFGDMAHVASVPAHIAARELMPAIRQKDETYLRKWLNDSGHAKLRTKRGTL